MRVQGEEAENPTLTQSMFDAHRHALLASPRACGTRTCFVQVCEKGALRLFHKPAQKVFRARGAHLMRAQDDLMSHP